MRVFVALDFPKDVKNEIYSGVLAVKNELGAGNYSRIENYHITLAFLGETPSERIADITGTVKNLSFPATSVSIGEYGCFNKGNKMVVYRKVFLDDKILDYRRRLCENLNHRGFSVDAARFSPHLTVAREISSKSEPKIPFINRFVKGVTFDQKYVTIFESKRIDGVLTYVPIFIS